MGHVFVFAVIGDDHVRRVNLALSYLKRFSRNDIVVVKGRSGIMPAHDQVIEAELPVSLQNAEASILLKTNLLGVLGSARDSFCYLDSDVIAVNDAVDTIFNYKTGPVTFAQDNVSIDMFSRHAVNCQCPDSTCPHLREEILCTLGVDVGYCDWKLWNGGVFLFDHESAHFLTLWHTFTRLILKDPFWRRRDQGTLAAAVWKFGLQDQPTLPRIFNLIVDRFWGVPLAFRSILAPARFHVWNEYSLTGEAGRVRPSFIHFVNGGIGKVGWRNWDEVAALLNNS